MLKAALTKHGRQMAQMFANTPSVRKMSRYQISTAVMANRMTGQSKKAGHRLTSPAHSSSALVRSWFGSSKGGENYALLETADSSVFVFRGSQDLEDFVVDLSAQVELIAGQAESQAVFGGAGPSVPRGFFTAFKE